MLIQETSGAELLLLSLEEQDEALGASWTLLNKILAF